MVLKVDGRGMAVRRSNQIVSAALALRFLLLVINSCRGFTLYACQNKTAFRHPWGSSRRSDCDYREDNAGLEEMVTRGK